MTFVGCSNWRNVNMYTGSPDLASIREMLLVLLLQLLQLLQLRLRLRPRLGFNFQLVGSIGQHPDNRCFQTNYIHPNKCLSMEVGHAKLMPIEVAVVSSSSDRILAKAVFWNFT